MALSQAHQDWKNAKKTYKAQLAGIKFNEDFGPDLDKLEKVHNTAPKDMGHGNQLEEQTSKMAAKCSQTAQNYLGKISHIEDTNAKNALTTILRNIKAECDKLK